MLLVLTLVVAGGYLLGSIPNGLLVARSRGIDIRVHGSGNIGATNVFRTLGKKWGIFVFILDFLKGLLAVRLGMVVAAAWLPAGAFSPVSAGILAGVSSILGHNFPVWLKFKGGKGIATSGGVLVGLLPLVTAILIPLWALVFFTTRYVSVASIAVAVALPVLVWAMLTCGFASDQELLPFAILVGALAVWRHRSNIKRLIDGTENRFGKRKESP